jgi:sporulation protein YlmC with PRC-barrel domain
MPQNRERKAILFEGRFIMTIKSQGNHILRLLPAVFFCIVLSLPAGASETPQGTLTAGTIIDQPVFNDQNQEIGELEDLVIKRNGSVKKVLISVGGFLEIGDKLVSARYKSVDFAAGKIVLNITRKKLEDQPEFDYRENGLFTTYHYRLNPYGMMPGPHGYYGRGLPPGHRRGGPDEDDRMPRSGYYGYGNEEQYYEHPYLMRRGEELQGMRGWYNPWNLAYFPARMLASVILGQNVVNKQGEEIAVVEDIIISTAGKVKQLILSYGGFLDIGDRLVAVPYRSIGFTNRGITYDISRRELENHPKYMAE